MSKCEKQSRKIREVLEIKARNKRKKARRIGKRWNE
jgi:hypothetical protein